MVLDTLVIIISVAGFYLGFRRGIIKTVFDTLAFILALIVTLKFSSWTVQKLQEYGLENPTASYIMGILITFIVVFLGIRWIGSRVEKVLEVMQLNIFNKLAGGLWNVTIYLYFLSIIVLWMVSLKILEEAKIKQNLSYPLVQVLPEKGEIFYRWAKPLFIDFWQETHQAFDSPEDKKENR
jgi:membrane protein required for colicin V production